MKEIYNQYYTQLIYFGLKLIKNNQVVEDIVIDCILKFFELKYPHRLANVILYSCVKGKCLNYLRNQKTRNKINTKNFDEEYIELQAIESRFMKIVTDAIDNLTPDYKEVIVMYYIEEKSCIEIARLLNKLPATIRSLKRHALNKLIDLRKIKRWQ